MARIRTIREKPYVVVVAGRLEARDMGRLEHACSPALMTALPDLEVDITRVTELDASATAVLAQMARRGAVIRRRDG